MSEEKKTAQEENSWQNIAYSNMIGNEALLRILVRKGLVTQEEFSAEVQEVHEAFMHQQNSNE
ncbi:MAG: hypothetical protein R6V55_10410 [Desulfovermiculus sp.]